MKIVIAMNSASAATIWRWPASATAALERAFPQIEFVEYTRAIDQAPSAATLAEDAALFRDADAAIAWRLDARLWRSSRRLRWIHCPSAAVHQLLSPELIASEIAVTNGASVHAATVAEHGLALMLALARGLPQALRDQTAHAWQPQRRAPALTRLEGAEVLLVGLGHIGRALAPRLAGLGMRVTGVRRNPAGGVPGCAEVHGVESLDSLLPQADYVVLALPAVASTEVLFGAKQFSRLRPGARLINLGRGSALDESALVEALRAGRLDAAALDVFDREPLASDSPLWDCERLLITPHTAGAAPDSWERQTALIISHLRRFAAGLPLSPLVDKRRGY